MSNIKPLKYIIFLAIIPLSLAVPSFAKTTVLQTPSIKKNFSYDGHIFFNATKSGVQGERYLLNEQLSNIKLTTDWQLTSWLKWHGLLIYNTLPTPITPSLYFEQAYFNLTPSQWPNRFISLGKKWLPFGSYKNDLIYKPFTKALGQTNAMAIELGYDNFYYTNVTLYHPHTIMYSSSLPAYYNLNAGLHDQFYDIGVSYLYSIADSQLFQYNKGFGGFLGQSIKSHVPGSAIYANFKYRQFNTYLTYISAMHPFYAEEISYQNKGARPAAFSIQSGYEFTVRNLPLKIIGFYDDSYEALALKLPKKRTGVGLNIYPNKCLDIQFQFFKDYNYASNIIAKGLNKSILGNSNVTNTFALQLVLNF
ncbi:MAG: LbtU family siderophore porin [Gammaproteobacteria bacterium]|nr:LbtU family siderophore porin [Gammaproteobacteria bacterium]MCW5584109.1 LbtU family siderophore porin [Gammaproteobacteria bacterium]